VKGTAVLVGQTAVSPRKPERPLHSDGYWRPASHLGDFSKFQRLARSNGSAPDVPLQADMCQTRAKILQHVQGLT